MAMYSVKHRTYGKGYVVKIRNGYATVKFGSTEKLFAIKGFGKYFEIFDADFQKIVDQANEEADTMQVHSSKTENTGFSASHNTAKPIKAYYDSSSSVGSAGSLLGPRSQTIPIASENQMFEIVGYMARPGRISSIEAEVPMDGRDELFERLFPGQTYRPITMGDTPSGMPNKLGPQFRINFADLRNCPQVLKSNMGAGNASCIGRINKSRFVLTVVQKYGFQFGKWQDTNKIRSIAAEKGYLEEFERGYSL